jgi:hypothetical protein
MQLLGNVGHVESCFGSMGHGVSKVHGLCGMYHRLRNCFVMHPMVLLGDEAQVEAHFGPFGDSANVDTR